MASYEHATFAHSTGPRQGVYPLQQWEHYKAVKWRATQFRAPVEMYNYRERIEPAVILPGPPALPPRLLTKRGSTSYSSTPQRVRSRTDLHKTQKHCGTKPPTDSDKRTANKEVASTFCVTTTSISMQSRPPQKERSGSRIPLFKQPSFPYPDPTKVKGDPAFEERLAQLAQHEANTVKQEELRQRSLTRPSSARSSTTSSTRQRRTSSSSISSQTRDTKRCQSALSHRASVPSSMISRRASNDIHSHPSRNHRPMSARELKQTVSVNTIDYTPTNGDNIAGAIDCTPTNGDSIAEARSCIPPKVSKEFLPETSSESAEDSKCKSLTELPGHRDDMLIESISGSEAEPAVVDDDLNVTSDLGLSLDSLHFSGEETAPELELTENYIRKEQSSSESEAPTELSANKACDLKEPVVDIGKSSKEMSVASKGHQLMPPSSNRTDIDRQKEPHPSIA